MINLKKKNKIHQEAVIQLKNTNNNTYNNNVRINFNLYQWESIQNQIQLNGYWKNILKEIKALIKLQVKKYNKTKKLKKK